MMVEFISHWALYVILVIVPTVIISGGVLIYFLTVKLELDGEE